MRLSLLFVLVCACTDTTSSEVLDVGISFPEADAAGGVIPFKAGGSFQFQVVAKAAQLGKQSRATVDILTPGAPADATTTATITLTDQTNGALAGSATLKWPSGGSETPLQIRTQIADYASITDVPLEQPVLAVMPGALSNTGAQVTQNLCFESTSTDGALSIHLNGAKFDTGLVDATVPLLRGTCAGVVDPKNPSSSARIKAFVSNSTVEATATLPPTLATATYVSPSQTGVLTLELTALSTTPQSLSIVDLTVIAKVAGTPTKDIAVSFLSVPNTVVVVPAAVKTDAQGRGVASFQMPAEGSVRITAMSGDGQSNSLTFTP